MKNSAVGGEGEFRRPVSSNLSEQGDASYEAAITPSSTNKTLVKQLTGLLRQARDLIRDLPASDLTYDDWVALQQVSTDHDHHGLLAKIHRALHDLHEESSAPISGWQPIDSAPIECRRVLVWGGEISISHGDDNIFTPNNTVYIASREVDEGAWFAGHTFDDEAIWIRPSHWMELPVPPEEIVK